MREQLRVYPLFEHRSQLRAHLPYDGTREGRREGIEMRLHCQFVKPVQRVPSERR
jgi:hypothetical protein